MEINAAVVYTNGLGGGKVIIRIGLYTLTATVNVLFSTGLYGSGENCHITGAGNFHLITINGANDCTIENLHLSGTSDGNNVDCIYINDSDRYRITSNIITESDRNGIRVESTGVAPDTSPYGWIEDNYVTSTDNDGIFVTSSVAFLEISGNILHANLGSGIYIDNGLLLKIQGNTLYLNSHHGIYSQSTFSNISDNICHQNDFEGSTYDGIFLEGAGERCVIDGNITTENGRYGIGSSVGASDGMTTISNNTVSNNYEDGIFFDLLGFTIDGNYIYNNGHIGSPGHGIIVGVNVTDQGGVISSNYITSTTESQDDGVHLNDGAGKILIEGNFFFYLLGSGVVLEANNDNCKISDNYFYSCTEYGIDIQAASCNLNNVKDNYYFGNGGCINDLGTDTITHEILVEVKDSDSNIGTHPSVVLPNNQLKTVRFGFTVPLEFQELVTAQVEIRTGATGNFRRSVASNYGKLCGAEDYDAHDDSIALGSVAVTTSQLTCFDIEAALDTPDIGIGDKVGVEFTRIGNDPLDTVEAECHYLGARIRYV